MIEQLIASYGYLAVIIGTFFEGETIVILAGFAAHRGYLYLPGVILAAFTGTVCADQLLFFIGRKHSQTFFVKYPSWRYRIEKAQRLLKRFDTLLILMFRFIYGIRTVTPFVIGMSTVTAKKFIILNIISAFIWAVVISCGGYMFGSALEIILGDIKQYEYFILGIIALSGTIILLVHYYRARKRFGESDNSCSKT